MSERQQITAPDFKDNFVMIPNLIDDSDLDPYEYRLLVHYYRVGTCWKNTTTTAKACNMSRPQVVAKRQSLEQKGWIKIGRGGAQDSLTITVIDRWDENHKKYMGVKKSAPPHMGDDQQAGQDIDWQEVTELTGAGQDVDSNNIPIKNNPIKNIKDSPLSPILEKWISLFPNKPHPKPNTSAYFRKAHARMQSPDFASQWEAAMIAASTSPTLQRESWFHLEFFLRNDENWRKCLVHWMNWKDQQSGPRQDAKSRLEGRLERLGE